MNMAKVAKKIDIRVFNNIMYTNVRFCFLYSCTQPEDGLTQPKNVVE